MPNPALDITMAYNTMIIDKLYKCPNPGILSTVSGVFSVQLSCLTILAGVDTKRAGDLVDSYVNQFSSVISESEKPIIGNYIADRMDDVIDALSNSSASNSLYTLVKCLYRFTETPYELTDAVEISKLLTDYVSKIMPYFPNIQSSNTAPILNSAMKSTDSQPESRSAFQKYRLFFILLGVIVAFCIFIAISKGGSAESSLAAPTPTPFTAVPKSITNNSILMFPAFERVCPFSVTAPENASCYVYLDYQGKPSNSTIDRVRREGATSMNADVGLYVSAGKTASTKVPIGSYKLYYASGETWYGESLLFGPDTMYYASDEILDFYADSESYVGNTLTLQLSSSGNYESYPVDPGDSPF